MMAVHQDTVQFFQDRRSVSAVPARRDRRRVEQIRVWPREKDERESDEFIAVPVREEIGPFRPRAGGQEIEADPFDLGKRLLIQRLRERRLGGIFRYGCRFQSRAHYPLLSISSMSAW